MSIRFKALTVVSILLMLAGGCVGSAPQPATRTEGVLKVNGQWVFRTGEFEVPAGKERFICYAAPVPERLALSRFSSPANPVIHHFLMVEALTDEPEGFSECDTLFRLTWAPIYAAVTAASELKIPSGAARILEADSQLVLQIHFLNTSTETVTTRVEVGLESAAEAKPTPVGITLFGDANFRLPPQQQTVVESNCTVKNDLQLYALLPHMHYKGQRLEFQIDEGNGFETVYQRDPFDFDNQYFERFNHNVPAGARARVRCHYDNDLDEEILFGEVAEAEMCLAVGFRVGGEEFEFCADGPPIDGPRAPRDPNAGDCGDEITEEGLGKECTYGGKECAEHLFCSADLLQVRRGHCFDVGCQSNDDCLDAVCCQLPILGNFANLCVQEACRIDQCHPVDTLTNVTQ